ncbi:small integral membrane protein 8 [Neodiprion pinetum]|nr:small integral membrane protein 8 isoform X2 [Neodiprion fabricii]XP_046422977.1 small integral membrane protein 8 isoform X2 [Neodiprion fabricii]XP_046478391.1 small integral membrane protein 8 isoform X2 [Neodiprion pinetum]XP_046478392.1 small integral membrane protein 8 isoform X2 [Neodiprion pinetum]XP_046478393.1 small integral membrane protein 8 isoform X2 [Neodiprion pinetum]XP_046593960.1 small integral membrane protein 8 isoform X2 [Neodiprion lecontei]XP_046593961.1 small integ
MSNDKNTPAAKPGDGLRSLRSTMLFRAINYELYVKPNAVIMALGVLAMTGCAGYILYMRSKYEGMGYYSAIEPDGKETFKKRKSKWDD